MPTSNLVQPFDFIIINPDRYEMFTIFFSKHIYSEQINPDQASPIFCLILIFTAIILSMNAHRYIFLITVSFYKVIKNWMLRARVIHYLELLINWGLLWASLEILLVEKCCLSSIRLTSAGNLFHKVNPNPHRDFWNLADFGRILMRVGAPGELVLLLSSFTITILFKCYNVASISAVIRKGRLNCNPPLILQSFLDCIITSLESYNCLHRCVRAEAWRGCVWRGCVYLQTF